MLSVSNMTTSLPKVIWEQGRVAAAVPSAGWHKGLRIRNVCIVLVKDRCANVRYFSVRVWRCMAIGNAFVLQTDSVRRQEKEQKKVKQYCEL